MSFKNKLAVALGMALAILFCLGVLSYWRTIQDDQNQAWVVHTHTVIETLDAARAGLMEAQNAHLSFLLSGGKEELARFNAAVSRSRQTFAELRSLTSDNPEQQRRLSDFDAQTTAHFSAIQNQLSLPPNQLSPGARALNDSAAEAQLSSDIQDRMAEIRRVEQQLLAQRNLKAQNSSRVVKIIIFFGYALALLFLVAAAFTVLHEMDRRILTEQTLRQSEERFRLMVSEVKDYAIILLDPDGRIVTWNAGAQRIKGYLSEEILGRHFSQFYPPEALQENKPAAELKIAAEDGRVEDEGWRVRKDGSLFWANVVITALRDEGGRLRGFAKLSRDMTERKRIERELEIRNAQLLTSNAELEAFCYSVSHDLRAPLRAIDGFSQAMLEDYSAQIDETGRNYLQRVRAGAQRMGILIDNLLTLSRVTRAGINRQPIDLTEMARSVAQELRGNNPGRNVELIVEPGLRADGDPHLVRTVLENLLGNAWKFTLKREHARIELGQIHNHQICAFFLRDNGAGFNQSYAHQLFVAFQRLHTNDEFPGTGIGLASVQRIVTRHGGRIWAQGAVHQGAVFYFTFVPHPTPTEDITNGEQCNLAGGRQSG
jgi:PAS domain S-box-containing protein